MSPGRRALLSGCEPIAHVETARGRPGEAGRWANRADQLAHQGLSMNLGLADLARARALSKTAPAAAEHAERAAGMFAAAARPIRRAGPAVHRPVITRIRTERIA